MLRLLTDSNISPDVVEEVIRHESMCDIVSLHYWENGRYLDEEDDVILAEAHRQGLTLVTRDVTSIPTLLNSWYFEGRNHSGVIFVDHRTIPDGNVGALVRALIGFWRAEPGYDWENRSEYLRPG